MPEGMVLLGTLVYLRNNGWNIESVSPAKGEGLPSLEEQKDLIRIVMEALEQPIDSANFFRSGGPDVIAHREGEVWKFECKGLGKGKSQTLKNNFDRAIASAVSYYDKAGTKLGLALPPEYFSKHRFAMKLPAELRKAINLYVLIVENKNIRLIEPGDSLGEAI